MTLFIVSYVRSLIPSFLQYLTYKERVFMLLNYVNYAELLPDLDVGRGITPAYFFLINLLSPRLIPSQKMKAIYFRICMPNSMHNSVENPYQ